jgi:hypothetical protein
MVDVIVDHISIAVVVDGVDVLLVIYNLPWWYFYAMTPTCTIIEVSR